ncbi:MAG: copper transporter, partial [Tumebacillaceae bacterium]
MCGLYGIRYHIITLIAVFLALGLGLLLGGTLGEQLIVKEQGQLLKRLEDRYSQARSDNAKWQKQAHQLEQRTQQLEQVSAEVGSHYVQDRLPGQKVAILQLEQADLTPLKNTLERAGVDVISTVQLTSQTPLFDPKVWPTELYDSLGIGAAGETDQLAKSRMQHIAGRLVQELYFQQQRQGEMVKYLQTISALTVSGVQGIKPDHVIVVGGARQQTMQRMMLFDTPLLKAITAHDLHVVVAETTTTQHSGIRYYRELGIST